MARIECLKEGCQRERKMLVKFKHILKHNLNAKKTNPNNFKNNKLSKNNNFLSLFFRLKASVASMTQPVDLSTFIIPVETTIAEVDCKKAFSALQTNEQLYVAHFTRASWIGSKICYF